MGSAQAMLAELDHETGGVCRTLERVPEDRLGWHPHARSMTLGGLASHLANVPSRIGPTIGQDSVVMNHAIHHRAQLGV